MHRTQRKIHRHQRKHSKKIGIKKFYNRFSVSGIKKGNGNFLTYAHRANKTFNYKLNDVNQILKKNSKQLNKVLSKKY